ncbi:hypothetical protein [Empedobacter falsenii]
MANNRDDFSEPTKVIIAKRAGYLCAFPNCGSLTISASDESDEGISSSGMACHISAASSGRNARRFDENMTSEERSHANNGIWMCYKHGKLIDTDEERFTTETLIHWKKLSAEISRLMHERSIDYLTAFHHIPKSLVPNNVIFHELRNENEIIGNAVDDSNIPLTWGKDLSSALRDFLIEISRNALTHGKAENVEIKIEYNKILLKYDGDSFDITELKSVENGNGGQTSYLHLLEEYFNDIIIIYKNVDGNNIITICKLTQPKEILEITSCTIQLSLSDYNWGIENYEISSDCKELFVVLPKYFTLSDLPRKGTRDKLLEEERPITFIGENLSQLVKHSLNEKFPNSRIIEVQ